MGFVREGARVRTEGGRETARGVSSEATSLILSPSRPSPPRLPQPPHRHGAPPHRTPSAGRFPIKRGLKVIAFIRCCGKGAEYLLGAEAGPWPARACNNSKSTFVPRGKAYLPSPYVIDTP